VVHSPLTSPPPSPPPPLPRQAILPYSPLFKPKSMGHPRSYYDPNSWFNEYSFTLVGDQEYIVLIQSGAAEKYVYPAFLASTNGPLTVHRDQEPYALCVLLRLDTPGVNLSVAASTSLAFLMENARVTTRLCYINNFTEFCLQQDHTSLIPPTQSQPNCNFITTYALPEPVIASRTQQVAARNPLLMCRMRSLPKIAPLPAEPIAE